MDGVRSLIDFMVDRSDQLIEALLEHTRYVVAVFLTADLVRITLVLAFPGLSLWLMRLIA